MKAKSLKGQKTRQRILKAAADLLQSKGFHATSIDDILSASKTGKSQFYHYFKSKESIVFELIDRFELGDPVSDHSCPSEPTFTPSRFSEIQFDQLNDFFLWLDSFPKDFESGRYRHGCPLGNLASEMATQNEQIRSVLMQTFSHWTKTLESELKKLKHRNLLPPHVDCAQMASITLSCLQGGMLLAKTLKNSQPLKQATTMIKLVLESNQGIKLRKHRPPALISFAP